MNYNNGFPVGYQYMQMPQPQPTTALTNQMQMVQQQPQQRQQDVLWVQGENAARAFMLAPGATVFLMDSEQPVFYIKSADQNGVPTLKIYDYSERTATTTVDVQTPSIDVEKIEKQLKSLNSKIADLENQVLDIATSPTPKRKAKEREEDDE